MKCCIGYGKWSSAGVELVSEIAVDRWFLEREELFSQIISHCLGNLNFIKNGKQPIHIRERVGRNKDMQGPQYDILILSVSYTYTVLS